MARDNCDVTFAERDTVQPLTIHSMQVLRVCDQCLPKLH